MCRGQGRTTWRHFCYLALLVCAFQVTWSNVCTSAGCLSATVIYVEIRQQYLFGRGRKLSSASPSLYLGVLDDCSKKSSCMHICIHRHLNLQPTASLEILWLLPCPEAVSQTINKTVSKQPAGFNYPSA